MVKLASMLSRLNPAKILVIGDMLLDTYTMGKAQRISPEAPVVIVNVQYEEYRPGGAGNVILNLLSLGAQVVAVGRIGHDWAGQMLQKALAHEGVHTELLMRQKGYRTPVKNRVIAGNQQIVRIDQEDLIALDEELEQYLMDALATCMQEVDAVALSDYGKGFFTPNLLQFLFAHAQRLQLPVITDPKGLDFTKYRGTTVLKPNLREAYAAANLPLQASLESVAQFILQQTQANLLMITRSEAGISLFDASGKQEDFPVHAKEVKDVTGAGDTVLAMLTYALANQLSYQEAAQLCNVAASIAIEHVGCAQVTLSALAYRLFEINRCHKVFDQEHLIVLQKILKNRPFNLLIIPPMEQLTASLFTIIKELSQNAQALVVYIDDPHPSEVLINMLASWREIEFIIIHLDSLKTLCHYIAPQGTYLFDCLKSQLHIIEWNAYLCAVLPIAPLALAQR